MKYCQTIRFAVHQLISLPEQMRDVWDLFNLSLNLPHHPIRSNTFRGQLQLLFPKPTRLSTAQWFSVTIHDIQKCGMKIIKTGSVVEHLNLERDSGKMYVPKRMEVQLFF